eukprot:TRINITY_DN12050_c0_g1_i1.p2 TRINITY_DN12050_c0_g1~~TRINITY_DN12050_c0_g1_i1.p2  ORF type:complete len:101 (-),score=8.97 TRINITY_DN12050_c0_g1_i1:216-518(-)
MLRLHDNGLIDAPVPAGPSTRGFDMERYVCSDAEQSFDELVASLQATIRSILSQTGAARGKALMATLHKVGFSAQVRSFRGPEPEFPICTIATLGPVCGW